MLNKIRANIKYISFKDVLSVFIFLLVLIPSLLFKLINKLFKRQIWIVTERENTASDNGYHFYKYLKQNHPEINSYYIINKKCKEYKNVEKFGNIIQFGSFKHWIYYIVSDKKISSQKASNPAPALFYVLHIYLNLFNNRVYLKHGIIKDDADWWYYKNTKYSKIICGAKKEYDFIKENFGYPENNVVYTGLARFDNLHDNKVDKNQILVIPTWRSWLGRKTNCLKKKEEFTSTNYYKSWNEFLNNKELIKYLEDNDLKMIFYPHINMKKFIDSFKIKSKNIIIINDEVDIQKLLKDSALMITDFSSVYMDFAYMKKPIIYYQFDKEEYRKNQYNEGYFVYERDGFGDVLVDSEDVIKKMIYYIENNYKIEKKYYEKMDNFFELNDNKNCERIYKSIVGDNNNE